MGRVAAAWATVHDVLIAYNQSLTCAAHSALPCAVHVPSSTVLCGPRLNTTGQGESWGEVAGAVGMLACSIY
jgi:hypothetical protein